MMPCMCHSVFLPSHSGVGIGRQEDQRHGNLEQQLREGKEQGSLSLVVCSIWSLGLHQGYLARGCIAKTFTLGFSLRLDVGKRWTKIVGRLPLPKNFAWRKLLKFHHRAGDHC